MSINKTHEQFFNEAALFYDEMTGFEEAVLKREKGLRNFILPGMKTAADVGCGTGMDSISLARLGLEVTGFDISAEMIEKAKKNAVQKNVLVRFIQSSADKISSEYFSLFNLVVSMGNTIANLNERQLKTTLKNYSSLLNENGLLLVQVLNYSRILLKKDRIINVTRKGEYFYTRFYDFGNKKLGFNILRFNQNNPADHSLITTTIYPHSYDTITSMLREAGFTGIKLWENLNRSLFEPGSSNDLVIEARK